MNAAVSYHRVSTVDQNPELARDELRRAAAMRGLDLVEEIEETGSGRRNNRPGLRRVLELVRSGRVSHVLVWKLTRFGRSTLDLLANIRELELAGATFVCTSQGIEFNRKAGAMGRLFLSVLAAIAEFDSEVISEGTVLGLADARKRGVTLGRRSLVSPEMVTKATELRSAGRSWSETARALGTHPSAVRRAIGPLSKRVPPDFRTEGPKTGHFGEAN